MHTKNIFDLIEWLKSTHPELLKFFLKTKPGGTELDENYLTENPSRILTPISIFESKIIVERVTGRLKEIRDSLKEKGIEHFKETLDTFDALQEGENAQNTFTQNVFFSSLDLIIFGKGSEEDMEVVQQRFSLYAKTNESGTFKFV